MVQQLTQRQTPCVHTLLPPKSLFFCSPPMAALSLQKFTVTKTLPSSSTNNLRRPSLLPCSKTMATPVSAQPSVWASINADITAYLRRTLTKREPLVVHEPMHDLVFAAPETMAPALCIAAFELVGGARTEAVLAAASAINLLRAAAYTHEHLPNLLERETPAAFRANIELLTGDSISPLGFELLARSYGDGGGVEESERIRRVIVEVARAGGARGAVEGQYKHVRWAKGSDGGEGDRLEMVKEVCRKKEGALYACGGVCGAILGGAREEEIEKLRRFGLHVGTIYGLLYGAGKGERGALAAAREVAPLALRELEGFEERKVGEISSLVDMALGLL
ncbi:hypothetical protein ACLOJK_029762 [Asimina triloba]